MPIVTCRSTTLTVALRVGSGEIFDVTLHLALGFGRLGGGSSARTSTRQPHSGQWVMCPSTHPSQLWQRMGVPLRMDREPALVSRISYPTDNPAMSAAPGANTRDRVIMTTTPLASAVRDAHGFSPRVSAVHPDDLERNISHPDDAWLAAMLGSIRSMRDAARWLLGIVVAWLFLVPQLTALRELVPVELPLPKIGVATALLVGSVGLIVWSVLRVQTLGVKSYSMRNLEKDDLAYVQEWDLLTNPPTPEKWRQAFAQHAHTLSRYQYLAPDDARDFVAGPQLWTDENTPTYPPPPDSGAAILAQDQLHRMRLEERNAVALLTARDVGIRFRQATWIILVGSFVAAGAILVLVGPPSP